jgi:hypothetical protein
MVSSLNSHITTTTERCLNYKSLTQPTTGAVFLGTIAAHHLFLGLSLLLSGIVGFYLPKFGILGRVQLWPLSSRCNLSNHAQLAASLALAGSSSMLFAHHVYAIPVYPTYLQTTPQCFH